MEYDEVINEKGQQYNICCKRSDVGKYVLLPEDSFRTDLIAKHLDDAVKKLILADELPEK